MECVSDTHCAGNTASGKLLCDTSSNQCVVCKNSLQTSGTDAGCASTPATPYCHINADPAKTQVGAPEIWWYRHAMLCLDASCRAHVRPLLLRWAGPSRYYGCQLLPACLRVRLVQCVKCEVNPAGTDFGCDASNPICATDNTDPSKTACVVCGGLDGGAASAYACCWGGHCQAAEKCRGFTGCCWQQKLPGA